MHFLDPKRWRWIHPILVFVVHMAVASILFIAIAFFALGLEYFVRLLESWGMDSHFTAATRGIKYLVWVLDAALFVIFLIRTTIKLGTELWRL